MSTTDMVVAIEKEKDMATQGLAIVAEAATYAIIKDDPHRDTALTFGQRVKRMRGMVGLLYDDPIDQAHKLHKSLCGRRNAIDAPLAEAETAIKRSLGTYEANKRAEIEAKRRAEEAKARRMAEALERERQQQIEAARKVVEDKRLAEAAALEAAGKSKEADAVLAAPIYVVAPPIAPPPIADRTPRYQAPVSVSTRTNWQFRIMNTDLIPREWLIPNEKAIGAYVRAQKDKAVIPGVDIYSEASASMK